jgi:ligand-binding sensor domain-containing protein
LSKNPIARFMPSVLRSLVAWLLITFPVAGCLAATFLADGYSIRVWQTEDGLPQNLVTSAAQTPDGYLWFGTYSGLARFDGERFQVFDSANTPELPHRRINCLFEDARGTLWIGQETGTLTRYKNGRFEAVSLRPETARNPIIGIGSDERGELWVMRQSGSVDSVDDGRRLSSIIASEHPGSSSRPRQNHACLVRSAAVRSCGWCRSRRRRWGVDLPRPPHPQVERR